MDSKAVDVELSGFSVTNGLPYSTFIKSSGSRGTLPSKLQSMSSHIFSAPPVVGGNIADSFEQCGQQKELMFSTTPMIFVFVFRQNDISFQTSLKEVSSGVVTITAPATLAFFRYDTIEICSSEVPGGVSTMR